MMPLTKCPHKIVKRGGYRGLYGGSNPKEEARNGYYESDSAWMEANRDAVIWFLRQHTKDPMEGA